MIQQLPNPADQPTMVLAQRRAHCAIVLCAADDHYVKPLPVTLRSAAASLTGNSHLHVILMDGGISEASFAAIDQTLQGLPITINVMTIDAAEVQDLRTSRHITHAPVRRPSLPRDHA